MRRDLRPEDLGDLLERPLLAVLATRTAAGDVRFNPEKMPIWVDHGERFFYGFPVVERRGFKIADDTRGPMFDPTNGQRVASAEGLASAREHLGLRFPMLKHAPLLESRNAGFQAPVNGREPGFRCSFFHFPIRCRLQGTRRTGHANQIGKAIVDIAVETRVWRAYGAGICALETVTGNSRDLLHSTEIWWRDIFQ